MRRANLERAALRIARLLGADGLLVGGLAVAAHGYVRATKDVDFVAKVPLEEVARRLREHGIPAVVKKGDPLEGDFPCVRGTVAGVPFDVLPPLAPISWDRAIELPMGKEILRIVDLDSLIRLKLRARGPQDIMDVAALVLRHPEHRRNATELAVAYQVQDKLEAFLASPRLRAEMAGRHPRRRRR